MGQSQVFYRFQDGLKLNPGYIATPDYGSTANKVMEGSDPRVSIEQVVRVKKNPGAGEFSSLTAALASITDASPTKIYLINMGPGDYIEPPILMKQWVYISGVEQNTSITASDINNPLFTTVSNCGIMYLRMRGALNSSLIHMDSTVNFYLNFIEFANATTYVNALATTGPCRGFMSSIFLFQPSTVCVDAFRFVSPSNLILIGIQNIYGFLPVTNSGFVTIDGPDVTVNVGLGRVEARGFGTGMRSSNGATFEGFSFFLKNFANGLVVDASPNTPKISLSGLTILDTSGMDIDIQNLTATGYVSGAWDNSRSYRPPGAPITICGTDPEHGFFVDNEAVQTRSRQVLIVRQSPGPSEYATIEAAVNFAATQSPSPSNVFVVSVNDGTFVENDIVVPPYIYIRGISSTITKVVAANPSGILFSLAAASSLNLLGIQGGASGIAVDMTASTGEQSNVYGCSFLSSDIGIRCASASFGFGLIDSCTIDVNASFPTAFIQAGHPSGQNVLTVLGCFGFLGATGTVFEASGPLTQFNLSNISLGSNVVGDVQHIVKVYNGAQISFANLIFLGTPVYGVLVPLIGTGPKINGAFMALATAVQQCIDVQHTGATGFFNGVYDSHKISIVAGALINVFGSDPIDPTVGVTVIGDIIQGATIAERDNVTRLLRKGTVVGVIAGGEVTDAGGLDVDIEEGDGFILNSMGFVRTVVWAATSLTLPANDVSFIIVNDAGMVSATPSYSPHNAASIIYLSRVVTSASGKLFVEDLRFTMNQHGNQVEQYLKIALGAIFVSGSTVAESVTPRQLNIGSGDYYVGTSEYTPSGGNNRSFDTYYRDGAGDWIVTPSILVVPNGVYDNNSGTLQPVTAGFYTKHLLFVVGDGPQEQYFLVTSQAEYATLLDAENGALPLSPTYFNLGVVRISSLVMQEGVNAISSIRDERPRIGFAPSASTGSAIHGDLLGLSADDHPQYLLANGTRSMSGNLNMGGNNITNVGTVGGVNGAAHGLRHSPLGSDPTPTAAPTTALSANTGNGLGIQDSLSRSDHSHAILTAAPGTIVPAAANTAGTSAGLAHADHGHAIGTAAPGGILPDTASAEGVSTSFSRADHVHGISAAAPVVNLDATSANAEGAGNSFSRSTHSHAIDTGVAVTQTPAQANAAGAAATLARSDHVHNIPVGTPVSLTPNLANAAGVAATFIRSDHVHSVPTAAPTATMAPDSANADGAAATFARSDHGHAFATGIAVSLTPDLGNSAGAVDAFSRSDHIHDVPTAIALDLVAGQAAAIGVAANFSRSDHVHGVPTAAPGANLNATSTNAEGGGSSLARASHSHAIDTGTPIAQVPAQANAAGTSVNLARSDHVHNIPVGTPVSQPPDQVSAPGAAATFVRSDHVHNIPSAVPLALAAGQAVSIGVAPSFARSDHVHGVPTAAPGVNLSATTANAEGGGSNLSRSSHSHAIDTGVVVSQLPAQGNAAGTASTLARSDHVHDIPVGTPVSQPPDQVSAPGIAATFVRSDHVHNIPSAIPLALAAGQAAAIGAAASFARSDHVHGVPTAAPGVNLSATTSNAEGGGSNLSRSSHSHAIDTGVVVSQIPAQANAAGTSANLARADHVHNLAVGTPVSLTPDLANAAGVAATFVRSDHVHTVPTAIALALAAGQAAAIGAASTFSRADHVHGVPTAAPVTIGTANADGVSTSFARADHVHSHGNQAGGALHAPVTTSVDGFMLAADKVKLDRLEVGYMQYTNSAGFTFSSATPTQSADLNTDLNSFFNGYFTKPTATNFVANFTGTVRMVSSMNAFLGTANRSWQIAMYKNGTLIPGSNSWAVGQNTVARKAGSFTAIIVPVVPGDILTFAYASPDAVTVTVGINDFVVSIQLVKLG